jgi:hypothetical protein
MFPFDPMDEEEDQLMDDSFEDIWSRLLSEIEKSIEDDEFRPDPFEPPMPQEPEPMISGGYELSLKNEFNLGPEEKSGLSEVPIPPLRMSGGARKPYKDRKLSGLFPRRESPPSVQLNAAPEKCPLRNYERVVAECSYCMHYRTFYQYSRCSIKEEEYLDDAGLEDEDDDEEEDEY